MSRPRAASGERRGPARPHPGSRLRPGVRLLALALAAHGAAACERGAYLTYDVPLKESTRQALTDTAGAAEPESEPHYLWTAKTAQKDEYLVSTWTVAPTGFGLRLGNATIRDLQLDWPAAAITDAEGATHAVRLAGTATRAALLPAQEHWEGVLYPAGLELEPGQVQPLLPRAVGQRSWYWGVFQPQELDRLGAAAVGRWLEVHLPVLAGDQRLLYRFRFQVKAFRVEREWRLTWLGRRRDHGPSSD
ncbi:MAG: hypothetical protein ABIL09_05525 [Gemmatimonadota bacterium]